MLDRLSPQQRFLAILLFLVAAAAFIDFAGTLLGPIMALLFLWFLLGRSTRNRPRWTPDRQDDIAADDRWGRRQGRAAPPWAAPLPDAVDSRPVNRETVHKHALTAVRLADRDPDRLPVLPVDIGLMVFKGDDDPVIHRTWPVDETSDYIQPFVQLRVPQVAVGRVRFEIVDRYHQPVFMHEDAYQLERGRNLVIPAARLPLHDEQNMTGRWRFNLYADGMLIARHEFTWEEAAPHNQPDGATAERRALVGEDGEINTELRAVLVENRLGRMSLDELLEMHDEDDANQAASQP